MKTTSPAPAPAIGRVTAFVLGTVVFVCIVMMAFATYLSYQLGNAERILASPESALETDVDALPRLRRALGHSGFLGFAQNFAESHDATIIPDMKAHLKTANDIIKKLPGKVSSESRHDMQAIVGIFDKALAKIENTPAGFSNADMTPLYTALLTLDARSDDAMGAQRLDAQNQVQFWTMMLTLLTWCSLIIAAALAAGIYLTLRNRNSAPMRALTQSVKNMARGDMRTSIWGMERQDAVGELARAIDLARYHFSQLPDMSLLSDQGPVRIRFEGNTRSLFEAMMQLITRDSEQVRQQAVGLTDVINKQQQAITDVTSKVESVLNGILKNGNDGSQHVKQVLHEIKSSAEGLRHAQDHAADQLNRIIPYLQERAHGMAEIASITGKQIAQTLQSLTLSERTLKSSADQSDAAVKKLLGNADDLGERLFGAVNLLQASGKVLAETTEKTQSRLNEVISQLGRNPVSVGSSADGIIPAESLSRVENLVSTLEGAQKRIAILMAEQTQATRAQIDLLTTHSDGLLAQSSTTAQFLATTTDRLREEQEKLSAAIGQITGGGSISTSNGEQPQLADIAQKIERLASKLEALPAAGSSDAAASTPNGDLLFEIKSGFETTVRSLSQMRDQLTNLVINTTASAPAAPMIIGDDKMPEQLQKLTAQIDATRAELAETLKQQIEKLETKISSLAAPPPPAAPVEAELSAETQQQIEQQTQILTELVATLGVFDAHIQELRSQVTGAKLQKAG